MNDLQHIHNMAQAAINSINARADEILAEIEMDHRVAMNHFDWMEWEARQPCNDSQPGASLKALVAVDSWWFGLDESEKNRIRSTYLVKEHVDQDCMK